MAYRVVYDVLDDATLPAHTHELIFLGGALLWLTVWFTLHRVVPQLRAKKQMRGGLFVGGLFLCIGTIAVVGSTYPTFADQRRCKAWARDNDYQTAEGTITRFKKDPGRDPATTFTVGDATFTYRRESPKTGGFRGSFTAAEAHDLQLRDGLPVRVAHRDGRILRIEVAD
jgi:hypothetical protein